MTNQQIRLALHGVFWLLLEIVFVWLFSIVFNFQETLVVVSLNILLLMVLFYAHTEGVNLFLERKKWFTFFVFSLSMFALVTYLRSYVSNWLIASYVPQGIFPPYVRMLIFEIFTSLIIAVTAIFYQLLRNRYERERQNQLLITEQQAAQLQLLKAQINPHFLFNALNNVYSLTVVKSDDAPKMLLKLSNLLRYVIYDSQAKEVLLEKEVAHLPQFIELFKMRSEDPLPISLTIEGNLAGIKIEPMILMPIVENCFKHADFDTNPKAFADINLIISKNYMTFKTRNSFDAKDTQHDAVGGVGLANIKRRLSLRYPLNFSFETVAKDGVFEVTLRINFRNKL
jgi:two-component system, LytTR family, sensor kinase